MELSAILEDPRARKNAREVIQKAWDHLKGDPKASQGEFKNLGNPAENGDRSKFA